VKTNRILGGTGVMLAFVLVGCATTPTSRIPRYVPQYSLPQRLPGVARINYEMYKLEESENLKERLEADVRENIFDGKMSAAGPVDVTIRLSAASIVELEISSNYKIFGKYEGVVSAEESKKNQLGADDVAAKKGYGFDYGALQRAVDRVTKTTNYILISMEDIKKKIAANRSVLVARMNGGSGGLDGKTVSGKNATKKLNIAVAELQAQNVSTGDASVIADMFRVALVKTGQFNVVEKSNMDKILAEQAFQNTGCTSEECAVKLGRLLNVKRMLVGSFGKLMNKYFVNVRVVDVETSGIVFAESVKGETVEEIEAGVKSLVEQMSY
jgi:TolB-like protein